MSKKRKKAKSAEQRPNPWTSEQIAERAAGRMIFTQAESWDRTVSDHGAYSHQHCCFCGKVLKSGYAWVMLSRNESGWWFIVDPKEAPREDEGTFGRFALPIGNTCLRKHPQFRFAVTEEPRHETWNLPLGPTMPPSSTPRGPTTG